jgi:hypothetical protein
MSPHECPSCTRSFETDLGVRVHHSKAHDETLPNRVCANCSSAFYSEYERKYCSEKCYSEAVSFAGAENPNYSGGKVTTSCEICSEEFEYYPSEKEGHYCADCVKSEQWRSPPALSGSDHPRWSGGKQSVECDMCGSEIERWPNEIDGRTFCDVDCQGAWLSENITGTDHPNWKETSTIVYGPGWGKSRARTLRRDNYRCQVCGVSASELGQNPDVHHITSVRWFVDSDQYARRDAHTLSNLVSLCRSCHRKAEEDDIPKETLQSHAQRGVE